MKNLNKYISVGLLFGIGGHYFPDELNVILLSLLIMAWVFTFLVELYEN